MASDEFLWIRTRDGSPTLWSNELGESFRSVKGAFTESLAAFVRPALQHAQRLATKVTVGEFGLGAGTNWMLWSLAAREQNLNFSYFAIERNPVPFRLGRQKWLMSADQIAAALDRSANWVEQNLQSLPDPRVFANVLEAIGDGQKADVWFHDPFGFDVNPDGYSFETLHLCQKLWQPKMWGGSYACNRNFKKNLEALGQIHCKTMATGNPFLKRERLEWTL